MRLVLLKQGSEIWDDVAEDQRIYLIGRSGHGADISINHSKISRHHARLSIQGHTAVLRDLRSTNGCRVNGNKIEAETDITLYPGDRIGFGSSIEYEILLEAGVVPPPKPSGYTTSGSKAHELSLYDRLRQKPRLIIGRETDCDLEVPELIVSRHHTEVWLEGSQVFAKDLGSKNGTYLNGELLQGVAPIGAGDLLEVGSMGFRLTQPPVDIRIGTAIEAENIEKVYPNGNIGLHPLSLKVRSQEFVAVMGPSGCGKSTLLKALNGDNPSSTGVVYIHGLELRRNFDRIKRHIGYVPQDDIVHRQLTVYKSLFYAAKLRLAADVTQAEIDHRIDEVLESLNINRTDIRNTKVGSLSGGQRKRVSIAVELLSEPSILFLDEPTSPLDPETVEEFLKCIRGLVDRGTTVVMVTHKPEDLNYVDEVVFLAGGGHLVYKGSREKILRHFKKETLIEVYGLLSSGQIGQQWSKSWHEQNPISQILPLEAPMKKPRGVSPFRQFYWLTRRYLSLKLSDRWNMILLMVQPLIVGGLVCLEFFDFKLGVLFLMAIAAVWFGVSNAAREIVDELAVYRRERLVNLQIVPYIMSKLVVLAGIATVQIVMYCFLVWLRYQGTEYALLDVGGSMMFMVALSVTASLVGLALSAMFNKVEQVITLVPIILMPQIMLSGVITKIESPLIEILSYCTLGRWGTEGLARIHDMSYTGNSIKSDIPAFGPGPLCQQCVPVGEQGATALGSLRFYEPEMLGWFNSLGANLAVIGAGALGLFIFLVILLRAKDRV